MREKFKEGWYLVQYVNLKTGEFLEKEMSDLGLHTLKKFVMFQVIGEQFIGVKDEVK